MTDNPLGLQIEQPVAVWNKAIQLNVKDLFSSLSKMVLSGATGDFKGVADNTIDLLKDAGLQNSAAHVGWLLIYQALQRSLVDLIKEYRGIFSQEISESQLETMAETIANQLNSLPVMIDSGFFQRPQDLPLLENLKPALLTWLQSLGATETQAATIHARLKTSFVLSLHQEWLAKPTVYACIG